MGGERAKLSPRRRRNNQPWCSFGRRESGLNEASSRMSRHTLSAAPLRVRGPPATSFLVGFGGVGMLMGTHAGLNQQVLHRHSSRWRKGSESSPVTRLVLSLGGGVQPQSRSLPR